MTLKQADVSASASMANKPKLLSGESLKAFWNTVWSDSEPTALSDGLKYFISGSEIKSKKVLDVGCGNLLLGSSMYLLCWSGSYTGVDISEVAIERAKLFYPESTFVSADVQSLPFGDRTFDLTVSFRTAELLGSTYLQALREIARVSSEGIMFEVPHVDWLQKFTRDNPRLVEDGVVLTNDKNGLEHVGLSEQKLGSILTELGFARHELTVLTYRERETMSWDSPRMFYEEEIPLLDVKNEIFVKAFRE
jgi:SAM-dependent methyltransferase